MAKSMNHRRLLHYISFWLSTLVLFGACTQKEKDRKNGKLMVVTTTGMIKDVVENVGRDYVDVIALMGPGVDPHLYKATHGDLEKLTNADVIFYNGLHLEGKMGEVLNKLSRTKPVFAVGVAIDKNKLRHIEGFENTYDPHIWFDVSLWKDAVTTVMLTLQKQDSTRAEYYATNGEKYLARLDSLHEVTIKRIQEIPQPQRILITAHDAFGYFGDAYGIQVKGLQGISTVSEFGLRDVTELVNFIVEKKVKAIFVETSVSAKSIEAVIEGCNQKNWPVKIGGNLYSDAMGGANTPEGTYIGMVNANVNKIVEALR